MFLPDILICSSRCCTTCLMRSPCNWWERYLPPVCGFFTSLFPDNRLSFMSVKATLSSGGSTVPDLSPVSWRPYLVRELWMVSGHALASVHRLRPLWKCPCTSLVRQLFLEVDTELNKSDMRMAFTSVSFLSTSPFLHLYKTATFTAQSSAQEAQFLKLKADASHCCSSHLWSQLNTVNT